MYDVFISFKNTDERRKKTEDSRIAEEIYAELKNRSVETFLSNYELEHDKWWPEIIEALQQARILILIGTSFEYIYSGQIRREWGLFLDELASGNKPGCEVIPYWKNIDIYSLKGEALELKKFNVVDINNVSVEELCNKIENLLPIHSNHCRERREEQPYLPKNNFKSDRFNYRTGYTELVGRSSEINFLNEFCINTNHSVLWTVICGTGGIGKSKLAYDFCKIIERKGWKVFYPSHVNSFIKEDLAASESEFLICFDYVKFELDVVEEIIQFAIDRRIRYKIRFLLIERDENEINEGFSARIREYHYHKGNLKLVSLCDADICGIIDDYVKNISNDKVPNDHDKKSMIDTLELVDPSIKRPLYVMFIADAWVDGSKDLRNWNREKALSYIANKELDRIYKIAVNYAKAPIDKKQYRETLNLLILFATFSGRISVNEITDIVCRLSSVPKGTVEELLGDSELMDRDVVKGIEPDIVGEYICIKILNCMDSASVECFFSELYDKFFTDMIAYIDKIYKDYTDIFLSSDWSQYATIINVPLSYSHIKNNMFNHCGFIHEVKLHEKITTISKGAFRDCDHLYKINFPDNLEIIDSEAFLNCVALEIAMPDDGKGWVPSVISIGDRAFKNCKKLKDIRIPRSVKEIGSESFAKCKELKRLEIPWEVVIIAHNAFEACASLDEVVFKNESKEGIVIQSEAFKGCCSLHKVINSKRIRFVGQGGFEGCSSLKSISLSDKLSELAESVFKGCGGLEVIDLGNTSIRKISKSVFEDCDSLTKVILPKSLSYIEARAFYNCINLNDIVLPDGIKGIDELAFCGCDELKLDSFGENIRKIKKVSSFYVNDIDEAFIAFATSYHHKEEVVLPQNIYRIGDSAFSNIHSLRKVTFHAGISGIGKEAFRECVHLKLIDGTFSGIKTIGQGAFFACSELAQIPSDAAINVIEDNTFSYCTLLESVRFNSKIKKIGKAAFSTCFALKKIFFKGKCDEISSGAFSGCLNFMLSEKYHLTSKDGLFYVCGFIFNQFGCEEMNFIHRYMELEDVRIPFSCIGFFENPFENAEYIRSISVPDSVTKLIKNNFAGTASLEAVTLPDSIKFIPEGTFDSCISLQSIKIGSNQSNSLNEGIEVGKRAFAGCISLRKISLPKGFQKIDDGVFLNCKALEHIKLDDNLLEIGNHAFYGCESLTQLTLPSSIEKIGLAAFENCIHLESVNGLENTKIVSILNETFQGCLRLKEIKLPNTLKSIGAHSFYDCQQLEKLDVFLTEVEYIGVAAFQNCYMLQEMVLPRKIKIIEKFLLKSCTKLRRVKIPPMIEEIRTSAFFDCNMLREVDLHNKGLLTKIEHDAFAGCQRLESMVLPAGIKRLTRGMFRGCVSLRKVEIPIGINVIPEDCFKDCKQLDEVITATQVNCVRAGAFRNCFLLGSIAFLKNILICEAAAFRGCTSIELAIFEKIRTIAPAMFMGCCKLKKVDFPQVKQIDNYAFYGCEELEDIPIENAKFRIGDGAFWNCYKLRKLVFSETLGDIQPSAFRNCESLEEVKLPLGIQRIHAASFRNAKSLSAVFIPRTTVEIHKSAFRDCTNLEDVEIESNHLRIEENAFGGCSNLYYFNFSGTIQAQMTAFDSTPIEKDYREEPRIEWVEQGGRLRVANEVSDSQTKNWSASKTMELFLYTVKEGEVCLDRYIGKERVIEIPDTINALTVVRIGDGCFEDRRDINEIKLPNSIETIGKNAFAGCRNLEKINLPDGISLLDKYAFKWCCNLRELRIPERVKSILPGVFMCCYAMEKIDLPRNLEAIGEGSFWRCENLSLIIPGTVDRIETGAFKGVNKSKLSFEGNIEDRFFEEWPYGEEVIDSQYGKGVVIGCDFIDKTRYRLEIRFSGENRSVIYPEEFESSTRFISDDGMNRHRETLDRIHSYSI